MGLCVRRSRLQLIPLQARKNCHRSGRGPCAGSIRLAGELREFSDTLFRSIGTYFVPDRSASVSASKELIRVVEAGEAKYCQSDRPIKNFKEEMD